VIAIAITLLILEIAVPKVGADASLTHALLHQWPSYFAYAISFVTIGIMWWNHHELFEDIEATDHVLMVFNLALLLCIAFIPFPTALLAEYLRQRAHETTAIFVYGTTYTATALAFNGLWFYAAYGAKLLRPGVNAARTRARTLRYLPGAPAYALTLPAALITPWLSLAMYAALAILYLIPAPE
jgi:TMEM175 potassium channel family protein